MAGMISSLGSCATSANSRRQLDELNSAVSDHRYSQSQERILAAAARVMQEHGWQGSALKKDNFSNTYWAKSKKDCEAGDKECGWRRVGIRFEPAGDGTRASFVYGGDAPTTEEAVVQIMKMTVELLGQVDPRKAKEVLEEVRSTVSIDR